MSPRNSRSTLPGRGGLCMRILYLLSEPAPQSDKDLAVAGVAGRDAEGDQAERRVGHQAGEAVLAEDRPCLRRSDFAGLVAEAGVAAKLGADPAEVLIDQPQGHFATADVGGGGGQFGTDKEIGRARAVVAAPDQDARVGGGGVG